MRKPCAFVLRSCSEKFPILLNLILTVETHVKSIDDESKEASQSGHIGSIDVDREDSFVFPSESIIPDISMDEKSEVASIREVSVPPVAKPKALQQETDDRLIKTAALKEYYTVVIAFLNSRVDIRDYSERMLYYSSKLVGDLPYYKAFVEHRRKNPPPPFVPLPSYNTVNDGKIQVSLQGKEEWLPIGNDGNLPAVKDLLQIRLDRRLVPTNADSASIIGRYGHGTVWACEKRYLDGALMLLRCNYLVEESHLLGLQKATKGVGPKVTGAIKKFLNPEVELDDDDDEVELREEREEFGENDSNVVDEEDEVEQ